MLRYPELRKLPKATGFKSVNFRRQTPGSPDRLLSPRPKQNILDLTHPASNVSLNSFPSFKSDELGIKAYPMALLKKPDVMWQVESYQFDSWDDRVARAKQTNALAGSVGHHPTVAPMILNNSKPDRVSMSFVGLNSKKRTSGKRHIRATIVKKIKTAINLIVIRGADVTELKGRPRLVLNQHGGKDAQSQRILHGWSYIFFPSLHIYRMPYHDLIPKLRSALRFIFEKGTTMEKRWAAQISLPGIERTLPQSSRVQGSVGVEVTRRPLTHTRHSNKDGYDTASTYAKQESGRSPTGRTPHKAPALFSEKDVSADARRWRLALDGKTNNDDEDWKDIDTQEDSPISLPSSLLEKTSEPSRPPPQQPDRKDIKWPSAPASPRWPLMETWQFSDAPSATTEAEDAWAKKYPTSVRDMAERKLFRRQPIFRSPSESKKSVQE